MEKKEFPNRLGKKEKEQDVKSKPSFFSGKFGKISDKVFGVIKFILGVCLLPYVYSASIAFLNELGVIDLSLQNYFWSGIITLIVIYLFIWEPMVIYTKGHRLLEIVFSFFSPLVKVAPYVIPIYTIVLFVAYQISALFIKSEWLIQYFLFLLGFSIGLHLVFAAKSLRTKQGDFLKANYIFGFSFVFIASIFLVAIVLSLTFDKFSLVNFANNSFLIAKDIFYAIFKQLFLLK